MKNTKKELIEFKEMLLANAEADWSENDPSEEFSVLAEKLQTIIDTSEPTEREKQIDNLDHYISDDDERYSSTAEALDLLEKQAEIDGSVMADDIVMMWEPLEYKYTVDQLLEKI